MDRCDKQLLVNTICYFAIISCGFAISIPLISITEQNNSLCILYLSIVPGETKNDWHYGRSSNCNFSVFSGLFPCILYGLHQGIYHSYYLKKSMSNPQIKAEMRTRALIFGNVVCAFLLLLTSCIISVGFARTCQDITKYYKNRKCSDAQEFEITDPKTEKTWKTGKFHDLILLAQIASWISFTLWLLLVFSSIHLHNRKGKVSASSSCLLIN